MEIAFREILNRIGRVYQGIQRLEIQPTKHNVDILARSQGDLEMICNAAKAMIDELTELRDRDGAKENPAGQAQEGVNGNPAGQAQDGAKENPAGQAQDGAKGNPAGQAQNGAEGGSDAPEGETGKEKTEAPEEAKKAEKNGGER